MDRKSIIILVVCVAAMFAWQPLVVNKMYPPKPGATNNVAIVTGTNAPATLITNGAPATAVQASAATTASVAATPDTRIPVEETPGDLLALETPVAHYIFTPRGGGIKAVELTKYPETVARKPGQKDSTNRVATLNTPSFLPALAIGGVDLLQGDSHYRLSRAAGGVRAEASFTNGLSVVKEYSASSNNYVLRAVVRIRNDGKEPITLPAQEWSTGTATPLNPQDDGSRVGVMWYDGNKAHDVSAPWFANATLGCFPGTPRTEFSGGESNVFWTAVHNQFFAMAVMTKDPAQKLFIRRMDLPAPTAAELKETSGLNKKPYAYEASVQYPAVTLAPGTSMEREFKIFAGPKEYRTLASIAGVERNNVDEVMGFGTFFGFFSKSLLLGMNWLHYTMKLSYGWAIIAITIIIKLLFWPLTRASTRSMKRMAALQPQMKAIQEKYKDDPVKMNRKTMEFMKEHKVSPLGGCLPMLLQMPVFIGFFYMIQSAIELRGASFLWVADLSRPDTLFHIPGLNFPFNLLPLIMGATMLWQAHLTPPSPGMDPTQAKIMKYMPLIFMVFLYNFSAGLTLYWTVQNLLTIAQTKLTKDAPVAAAVAPVPVQAVPKKRRQP